MARIKNYLQDETKPFGVGEFVFDDGSSYYLDDPERARSVLEDIGRDSTNIAERGSVDRQGSELDKRQKLENVVASLAGESEPNRPFQGIDVGASSMRRAVAGPGGGEPIESRDDSPNQSVEPTQSRAEPEALPPSPAEIAEIEAGRRWQNADSLVSRTKRGTDLRALGPGVRVDKSYSRKGGLPMGEYEQQAEARGMAYQAGNELVGRHYREDQAAAELAASRLESEALAQKKANAEQALALQRKEEKYTSDRAWLEKDVDDYYDKKPDPDGGLRKERGPVGNIASAIAQFLGAYSAVISGSPNFANQILNKKIDDHVNAQVEEFRRGRMKRDGMMQRMAERGMSLDQMKSALKVQQELAVQKEIKATALREGSREAKQAAEALLMDRQERAINAENEFRTKALGEETVSGEMVRPTGPRAKTPLELAQERNALLGAQVEGEFLARGGAPAERAEDRADKRIERAEVRADKLAARKTQESQLTEAQAKAESAHQAVTHLGGKAGLVRDRSGKWVVGGGAVPPGLIENLAETASAGIYQGEVAPAFDAAVEAFGRQQSGGVIGKDERPAFEVQLGKKTFSRQQLADRLNAAEINIEAKRKQDVNDVRAGRTNAAPSRWKKPDEEDEE